MGWEGRYCDGLIIGERKHNAGINVVFSEQTGVPAELHRDVWYSTSS